MKKIISLVLSLLMLASLSLTFTSCGEKKQKLPDKVVLENVWNVKTVDLPAELTQVKDNNYSIGGFYCSNDTLYMNARIYDDQGQKSIIFSSPIDNINLKPVLTIEDSTDAYSTPDVYRSRNLQMIRPCDDGFWALFGEYYSDYRDPENGISESYSSFEKYDRNGNKLATYSSKEIFGKITDRWGNESFPYISDILERGNEIILFDRQNAMVYIAPSDFSKENIKSYSTASDDEEGNRYIYGSGVIDGKITVLQYDNNWNLIPKYLDESAGTFISALPEGVDNPFEDTFGNFMTGDAMYVIDDSSILYRLDPKTFEKQPVINYINSSINPSRIGQPVGNDSVMVVMEWDRNYEKQNLLVMTPNKEVIEKYVITYASRYQDSNVTDAAIEFNRANSEYCIQMRNYSEYDNYNQETGEFTVNSGTQMDLDMLSSTKRPDIIDLSNIGFVKYARMGLLADLGALIDADETVNRSDYLENILNACSFGGKIYAMPMTLSLQTTAAKLSIMGDKIKLSFEDLTALQEEYPEASLFELTTTRNEILLQFFAADYTHYIDQQNATCNFTDGSFARLLEYAASFPEAIDWESYYGDDYDWQAENDKYKNNQTLFASFYIGDFTDLRYMTNNFGEELALPGFPTTAKSGSLVVPSNLYGITSSSPFTDKCWEFIKTLMNTSNSYGFQMDIKSLEEKAAEAMKAPDSSNEGPIFIGGAVAYTVEETVAVATTVVDDMIAIDPVEPGDPGDPGDQDEPYYYWNRPITQSEVDRIMNILKSTENLYIEDANITKIIQECVAPFFAGQKSADEVCKQLQSRVSLILSENQ